MARDSGSSMGTVASDAVPLHPSAARPRSAWASYPVKPLGAVSSIPALSPEWGGSTIIRLCEVFLPLIHSPSDDVEDMPVLVFAELGFARVILFGEFEDGPAAQQPFDIAPRVKVHPAFRQIPAVIGAE